MSKTIQRSVCPFDCPDACSLLVEIQQDRARKVSGDSDHPHTQGFLCPKMAHYEQIVHSPDRLTTPLKRVGPKGEGAFEAITWDEAIQTILTRWQQIIALEGAEAILPYSYAGTMGLIQRNCGEAFFHRLGASRLARTICADAKGAGWASVMGDTLSIHPGEVRQSDFILLWGTNAMATNIHLLQMVREAKKKGAEVWLIDTYETPTAAVADQLVLSRPGRDGALALGIMHLLVRDRAIDQAFVDQYVQGFDAFRDQILPHYTPEVVSAMTGIPVSLLERLALKYGQAKAPFISMGSGLSRYGNGAMTVRTITCLPALVGAWAKPGGGILESISSGNAFQLSLVTREDFLSKPTRIVNMNQLGQALLSLTDPPIQSLYVYHSNPVTITPDQNQVIAGLLREDLFTVVHERFLTDTALYADLVLPATSSLEHADLYRSYGHYGVQKASALLSPVGQAKSNWEVFQLLAQGLHFPEAFFHQSAEELIDLLLNHPTPWLQQADLNRLKEGLPIELPLPDHYKMHFQTPSRKIELHQPSNPEPFPRYLEPHGDEAPFFLVSAPSLYSLNSTFNELPQLVHKKKGPTLMMNPSDANQIQLQDGQMVLAYNTRGEVPFILQADNKVPKGVLVTEGLFWLKDSPGPRTVNALTAQRLTDLGSASTLYDVKVFVKAAPSLPSSPACLKTGTTIYQQ